MVRSNSPPNRSGYFQLIRLAIASWAIIITIKAVSVMMFASLGATSDNRFSYVLVLQLVLAAIGISSYFTNAANLSSKLKQVSFLLCTILCGVLLGFYYGGSYTDNNSQYAIFGAIAGGIILLILAIWQERLLSTAIACIACICAYSLALMSGIRGINLLAASLHLPGLIWLGVSLIYLGITVGSSFLKNTSGKNSDRTA